LCTRNAEEVSHSFEKQTTITAYRSRAVGGSGPGLDQFWSGSGGLTLAGGSIVGHPHGQTVSMHSRCWLVGGATGPRTGLMVESSRRVSMVMTSYSIVLLTRQNEKREQMWVMMSCCHGDKTGQGVLYPGTCYTRAGGSRVGGAWMRWGLRGSRASRWTGGSRSA